MDAIPETEDLEELRLLLWKSGRKGSAPALRMLYDLFLREDETGADAPSVIDELARRREAATG